MNELWLLCEHGETRPHMGYYGVAGWDCPGGHPATVEEVVEWLAAVEWLKEVVNDWVRGDV